MRQRILAGPPAAAVLLLTVTLTGDPGEGREPAACCIRQTDCSYHMNPTPGEPQQCEDEGGYWVPGPGCPDGCSELTIGACCLGDETCVLANQAWCELTASAHYMGAGTICDDFDCTLGACCLPSGICEERPVALCEADGGIYRGAGTVCGDFNQNGADDICETIPVTCRSDSNEDGVVDIIDFLTLLTDWGPCP